MKNAKLWWIGGGAVALGGLGYFYLREGWGIVARLPGGPNLHAVVGSLWDARELRDQLAKLGSQIHVEITWRGQHPSDAQVVTPMELTTVVMSRGLKNTAEALQQKKLLGLGCSSCGQGAEVTRGLAAAQRMYTEGWKDGNYSWIDVKPAGGPRMRITHQLFAGERGSSL